MSHAVDLIKNRLAEIEPEIEKAAGALVAERDELLADLKRLTRGQNGAASGVTDEQIVQVLKDADDPLKSDAIARALGVTGRQVSGALRRLTGSGAVAGDKDAGYTTPK